MATPKRKYSFGLISRLALIVAFVGLGSWAVFNSKFKQNEPEQIVKHDNDSLTGPSDDVELGPDEASGDKSITSDAIDPLKIRSVSEGSGAQPVSFLEKNKPSKIDITGEPQKKGSKKSITLPPSSVSFGSKGKFSRDAFGQQNNSGGEKKKSKNRKKKTGNPLDTKTAKSNPASTFSSSFSKKKQDSAAQPTNWAGDKSLSKMPSSNFQFREKKGAKNNSQNSSGIDLNSAGSNPSGFVLPGKSPVNSKPVIKKEANGRSGFGDSGFASGSSSIPADSSGFPGAKPESPKGTFNPSGSFQPPQSSAPKADALSSMPSSSFPGSGSNKAGLDPTVGGGFRTQSSSGGEEPLRNNSLRNQNEDPGSSGGRNNSEGLGNSAFSLSADPNLPAKDVSDFAPSSSPRETKPERKKAGNSSAVFGGGVAFQDKGSRPLPKNERPQPNGLAKSKGTGGTGPSSIGFAEIGKPSEKKQLGNSKNSDTSLDPKSLNSLNPKGGFNGSSMPMNSGRAGKFGSDTTLSLSGKGLNSEAGVASSSRGFSASPDISANRDIPVNPDIKGSLKTGVNDRKPGPSSLEGIQSPSVTLQKVAPNEIQVNVESEFQLVVRNIGRVAATNIAVVDPIPEGTQFVSADPMPSSQGADGNLVWKFGSLAPGQQKVINIRLLPQKQGEIGSVARLSFQAAATAKSICTKPEVSVTHTGPQKVLQGQNATFLVTIQNNGDGIARDVVIEDEVPVGFAFGDGKGSRLAYEIGNLAPGARRQVRLDLRAVEAGRYVSEIRAKIGKTMTANHKLNVEVVSPELKMEIVGPTRRYIQREAKYKIEVENEGTASANNVLMVTRLPPGLKFVRTNNQGQYSRREHAVYWSMVELTPQNRGSVELILMPMGTGQQEIEFEARSQLVRTELKKFPVIVDQLAELFFEVDDRDDPIEVNGETEYRIRVVNQGSKSAANVVVKVEMPVGIEAIDSQGPSKGALNGSNVTFAPIATLAPRGELIYKIKAKGVRDGNHLINVLLSSAERRQAVAKQESTKVYSEYR